MKKQYKQGETIRAFDVENDRVLATLQINGAWVSNPRVEDIEHEGWMEHTQPEPEPVEPTPYIPTLEELVERKIRERYSLNQEFEVQRKREVETEAFQAYYAYVEECIAWAHEQEHREEESL